MCYLHKYFHSLRRKIKISWNIIVKTFHKWQTLLCWYIKIIKRIQQWTEKTMHTHNVMHMHGLRSLSANGLSNINKIHIHNLCHHCHIHNVFHFRSVHHLSFQVLFLFTNIQSLSISLSHFPSLSPSSLSSATFTVTLQTCTLSPFLSLSLYLQPRSPIYSLLLWTHLTLSVSLSLSILYAHPTNNNMSYKFDYSSIHF